VRDLAFKDRDFRQDCIYITAEPIRLIAPRDLISRNTVIDKRQIFAETGHVLLDFVHQLLSSRIFVRCPILH
jgi:hypothetical protein